MTTTKETSSEEKNEKKAVPAKIFDISRPGQSMPSATARPTIITHRSLARDPMMSPQAAADTASADDEPEKPDYSVKITKTRIEPLHADTKPDETPDEFDDAVEPAAETGPIEEPQDNATNDNTPTPEEPKPATSEPTQPTEESDEELDEMSDLAGQAALSKGKKAEDEAAKKRRKVTKQLVASKKYFLPINTVKHRKVTHAVTAVVIVVLVLAVAGAVAAIDAGLLDVGIELPFDLL